ncbi:hypothetical protein D3C80_897490 [compost metagenome]
MRIAQLQQFVAGLAKAVQVLGAVGQVAVAPAQVAVDGELLDALAHQLDGLQAVALEAAHAVVAEYAAEALDLVADAADQLPAVAAAGAPADLPRLQQRHRVTAAGQLDGAVQSGVAAADDAHVGDDLPRQCGELQVAVDAGGVPGWGVLGAMAGHLGNRLWLNHQHRPAEGSDQAVAGTALGAGCRAECRFFRGVLCRDSSGLQGKSLLAGFVVMPIQGDRRSDLSNHCGCCAAQCVRGCWHAPCFRARARQALPAPSTRAKRTP